MPSQDAASRSHDALSTALPAFSAIRWHSRAFCRYSSKILISFTILTESPGRKCKKRGKVPPRRCLSSRWKRKSPARGGAKGKSGTGLGGRGECDPPALLEKPMTGKIVSGWQKEKGTFRFSGSTRDQSP